MSLEEKISYYNDYHEEDDFLQDISYQEFFDKDMFDYLSNGVWVSFGSNVWIKLFRTFANNQELMNQVIKLMCENGCSINSKDFSDLMTDDTLSKNFLIAIDNLLSKKNQVIKSNVKQLIFNTRSLLNRIIHDNSFYVEGLYAFLLSDSYMKISRDNCLVVLSDQRFLKMLSSCDISMFLRFVNKFSFDVELEDLIQARINSLSYRDRLRVAKYCYNRYGKPKYLEEIWNSFKDRIEMDDMRSMITSLRENSLDEEKEKVRQFINTDIGKNIFLKEILEPTFSNIINWLNLDKSLYAKRKEMLANELSEYHKYDIETIRELLCTYCFEDNCNNIMLRLKTIIEYANESDKFLLLVKNDIKYITRLYEFLTKEVLEINPLELVRNIDINDLIRQAHSIFMEEVNKKTDISDILNSNKYKMVNGVKVIDVYIPLDRSYFLVHSEGKLKDGDAFLEKYKEGAYSHNRICTSILDNSHVETFLDGVVFGYCNVSEPLYSALPFDGQTNQRISVTSRPQYRSVISSVERFMNRTITKYNELTFFTDNKVILPSYIFVANREPSELDLKVAKDFNIPIFIYHTKEKKSIKEPGYSRGEDFDYSVSTLDYMLNEYNYNKEQDDLKLGY